MIPFVLKLSRIGLAAAILAVGLAAVVIVVPVLRPRCTQLYGHDSLTIALSKLSHNGFGFFCYRDQAGERLRFLLARDSHGKVQAAFDACRQCFRFHKGYMVSGGYLICRLCGTRYKINEMKRGKASCVPVALPVQRKGDSVTIKVADLRNGARLF